MESKQHQLQYKMHILYAIMVAGRYCIWKQNFSETNQLTTKSNNLVPYKPFFESHCSFHESLTQFHDHIECVVVDVL